MLVVEQTAVNTVGKWSLEFIKEDYLSLNVYTVAVYIYRYTVASAIMVFINCCSIESLKFILESSGFVLYFTVVKYFGSRTMCHQNPFGDDFPFYFIFYTSIQFQLLIWHLYILNIASWTPFFFSALLLWGFSWVSSHFIAHSRVIPDTSWFLSPHTQTFTNLCHFCFLNMYQISPPVSPGSNLSVCSASFPSLLHSLSF